MDSEELNQRLAHDRASSYAPMPKHDPIVTGVYGALAGVFAAFVFGVLAGLDMERIERPAIGTAIIGFLVPYLYLKNMKRLHWKAWLKEYNAMRMYNDTGNP